MNSKAADHRYEDLTARQRRRRLASTLIAPLLGGTLLVVLYYYLPLNRRLDAGTAVFFAFLLLVACGVLALEIRQIAHSRYPRLRAVGALAVVVPLFLIIFAAVYYLVEHSQAGSFSEHLSRTDSLYFTVTIFSTVGFGDIVPKTETARVLVMIQMLGDLVLIGLLGRVILGAVGIGLQRQGQQPPADAAGTAPSEPAEQARDRH